MISIPATHRKTLKLSSHKCRSAHLSVSKSHADTLHAASNRSMSVAARFAQLRTTIIIISHRDHLEHVRPSPISIPYHTIPSSCVGPSRAWPRCENFSHLLISFRFVSFLFSSSLSFHFSAVSRKHDADPCLFFFFRGASLPSFHCTYCMYVWYNSSWINQSINQSNYLSSSPLSLSLFLSFRFLPFFPPSSLSLPARSRRKKKKIRKKKKLKFLNPLIMEIATR